MSNEIIRAYHGTNLESAVQIGIEGAILTASERRIRILKNLRKMNNEKFHEIFGEREVSDEEIEQKSNDSQLLNFFRFIYPNMGWTESYYDTEVYFDVDISKAPLSHASNPGVGGVIFGCDIRGKRNSNVLTITRGLELEGTLKELYFVNLSRRKKIFLKQIYSKYNPKFLDYD